MKKTILFVLIIVCISIFSSCKECKTCKCWKDGQVVEMENCAYGFPPSTQSLDSWERYLVEVLGYDSVRCR